MSLPPPRGFNTISIMTKLTFHNQTLTITDPQSELVIAEQEKAQLREYFEISRKRLMQATRRVQELKAQIYYGKEACNG